MHVGVEKLDATQVAQDSRRLLVTYKEPRNDAAICPHVREGTNRSRETSRQREELFQILILECVNAPSFLQASGNRIFGS